MVLFFRWSNEPTELLLFFTFYSGRLVQRPPLTNEKTSLSKNLHIWGPVFVFVVLFLSCIDFPFQTSPESVICSCSIVFTGHVNQTEESQLLRVHLFTPTLTFCLFTPLLRLSLTAHSASLHLNLNLISAEYLQVFQGISIHTAHCFNKWISPVFMFFMSAMFWEQKH